ncbi:MAG: hypothetical protein IPO15_06250 [Anaerolineae bacterium]|uniref:hypothetical protein n=1 Tax=Candidatus Amarolinea dominans TaxID=3140696 RepID=UPI0031366F79|nr:hypothetical protein [Anaerolineae bacterium]
MGDPAPGAGNLVSGNTHIGVWISWSETTGNQILGNMIGTDANGNRAIPNYHGILISGGTANQVGGTSAGAGNLISGNEYLGIWLEHYTQPGNTILGNIVGANRSGTEAIPNYKGILITSASSTTVGGSAAGAGNLVSGNTDIGVKLELTSTLNSLVGNLIGTDVTGQNSLPNGGKGILIGFGQAVSMIGGALSVLAT